MALSCLRSTLRLLIPFLLLALLVQAVTVPNQAQFHLHQDSGPHELNARAPVPESERVEDVAAAQRSPKNFFKQLGDFFSSFDSTEVLREIFGDLLGISSNVDNVATTAVPSLTTAVLLPPPIQISALSAPTASISLPSFVLLSSQAPVETVVGTSAVTRSASSPILDSLASLFSPTSDASIELPTISVPISDISVPLPEFSSSTEQDGIVSILPWFPPGEHLSDNVTWPSSTLAEVAASASISASLDIGIEISAPALPGVTSSPELPASTSDVNILPFIPPDEDISENVTEPTPTVVASVLSPVTLAGETEIYSIPLFPTVSSPPLIFQSSISIPTIIQVSDLLAPLETLVPSASIIPLIPVNVSLTNIATSPSPVLFETGSPDSIGILDLGLTEPPAMPASTEAPLQPGNIDLPPLLEFVNGTYVLPTISPQYPPRPIVSASITKGWNSTITGYSITSPNLFPGRPRSTSKPVHNITTKEKPRLRTSKSILLPSPPRISLQPKPVINGTQVTIVTRTRSTRSLILTDAPLPTDQPLSIFYVNTTDVETLKTSTTRIKSKPASYVTVVVAPSPVGTSKPLNFTISTNVTASFISLNLPSSSVSLPSVTAPTFSLNVTVPSTTSGLSLLSISSPTLRISIPTFTPAPTPRLFSSFISLSTNTPKVPTKSSLGIILPSPLINTSVPFFPAAALDTLTDICTDPKIKTITLPLLDKWYGPSGYPTLHAYPGCVAPNAQQASQAPGLLNCTALGTSVQKCQEKGIHVLLGVSVDSPAAVNGNLKFGASAGLGLGLKLPLDTPTPPGPFLPGPFLGRPNILPLPLINLTTVIPPSTVKPAPAPNLFDAAHSPSALALTLSSLFAESHAERADLRPLGPDAPSKASPDGIRWTVSKPLGEEVVLDGFDIRVPGQWKGTAQAGLADAFADRLRELLAQAWKDSGSKKGGAGDGGVKGPGVVVQGYV